MCLCTGSSAVGQRVVKQLRVTSSSPSHLPLFADLLSPQRTFTVMNAVRPLAPQGQSILLLDFTPQVSTLPSDFVAPDNLSGQLRCQDACVDACCVRPVVAVAGGFASGKAVSVSACALSARTRRSIILLDVCFCDLIKSSACSLTALQLASQAAAILGT